MELRGFKDSTETSWAWGSGYHSGNLECFTPKKKAVLINNTLLPYQ